MIDTTSVEEDQIPADGWFPVDEKAPMFQTFFKADKQIGQVVKIGGKWTAYSLLELNASKTTGKPLGTFDNREEAKKVIEEYAIDK